MKSILTPKIKHDIARTMAVELLSKELITMDEFNKIMEILSTKFKEKADEKEKQRNIKK